MSNNNVPADIAAAFQDSPSVNTWAQNEAQRVQKAAATAIAAQLAAAGRAKNDKGYAAASDAFINAIKGR